MSTPAEGCKDELLKNEDNNAECVGGWPVVEDGNDLMREASAAWKMLK